MARFHINLIPCNGLDIRAVPHSESSWIEAALLGLPSVSWKSGAYAEVICDGEDGFAVESEEEWIRVLNELIANPDMRKRVGTRALERVQKDFAPEVRGQEMLAFYKSLLKAK